MDTLLSPDAKSWDDTLVRVVFEEEVANLILQILISRLGGEDFLSWPFGRLGIYTVRSAYQLARSKACITAGVRLEGACPLAPVMI